MSVGENDTDKGTREVGRRVEKGGKREDWGGGLGGGKGMRTNCLVWSVTTYQIVHIVYIVYIASKTKKTSDVRIEKLMLELLEFAGVVGSSVDESLGVQSLSLHPTVNGKNFE